MPRSSVLVLNSALVRAGLPAGEAFGPIMEHAVVRAAFLDGAKVADFPNLGCMSAISDRGLRYVDVLAGRYREDQQPLGPFDVLRVRRWWREGLPQFFGKLPPTWLPCPLAPAAGAPS